MVAWCCSTGLLLSPFFDSAPQSLWLLPLGSSCRCSPCRCSLPAYPHPPPHPTPSRMCFPTPHPPPQLVASLVHERDLYLAWSLKRSKAVNGARAVVGVVGKGHLRGVCYALTHDAGEQAGQFVMRCTCNLLCAWRAALGCLRRAGDCTQPAAASSLCGLSRGTPLRPPCCSRRPAVVHRPPSCLHSPSSAHAAPAAPAVLQPAPSCASETAQLPT